MAISRLIPARNSIGPRSGALIVFAVLLLISGTVIALEPGDTPPSELGTAYRGEAVNLDDGSGQVRIISFWATWCAPCMKELPILDAIQKQVGNEYLHVIAVNLEEPRRQFLRAMNVFEDSEITFIHDKRGKVAKRYGVRGIPYMLMLDVDGTVAFKHIGYGESALEGIVRDINYLLVKNGFAVEE